MRLARMAAAFEVRPCVKLGAQVDLDLSAVLGCDASSARGVADRLRAELDVHGLLIFRNQHDLTPEHHLAVAEWFGSIFPLPGRFQHPRSPHPGSILRVSNTAEEGFTGVGTTGWHIDGASYPTPFKVQLLSVVHVPASPGPTMFMPLYPLARHVLKHRPEWRKLSACVGEGDKTVKHPLLFEHPRTRRPSVVLGKLSGLVWNQSEQEDEATTYSNVQNTAAILAELDHHTQHHASVAAYRHDWQAGDLVIADNLAIAHLAPPETQLPSVIAGLRVLHRIVVAGDDPLRALQADCVVVEGANL
jgi:taurine dioxygenase